MVAKKPAVKSASKAKSKPKSKAAPKSKSGVMSKEADASIARYVPTKLKGK